MGKIKIKLRILQRGLWMLGFVIGMGWVFYPTEAAGVLENIEVLDILEDMTIGEENVLDICNASGGYCVIDNTHNYSGIHVGD